MTHATHHPLDRAVQTATTWLADVRAEFGTDDSEFAYRVTKAWLHAVRDRLPVIESAHFAAQLPDLLRGVYYEGWQPSAVPIKCHVEDFVRDFAEAARITPIEVPKVLWAVSDALNHRMTNIDKMLDPMPADIRALLRP
jgi:uncharacterized protein (DUF2267 family)